jgi:hypothetical protein
MDISDRDRLLNDFRAVHGWRYRYVARAWWVFDGTWWLHQGSLERMGMALAGLAGELFPPAHKIHGQLNQDYMIRRLARELIHTQTDDRLPAGNPRDFPRSSEPPARPDPGSPAPPSAPGPRQGDPNPVVEDPTGTVSPAGHTP